MSMPPVWADFEAVWSHKTPNSLVHIKEGESFPMGNHPGSVRSRCGRTLPTANLDRSFETRGAMAEPHRHEGQRRRWCDRCVRTMS